MLYLDIDLPEGALLKASEGAQKSEKLSKSGVSEQPAEDPGGIIFDAENLIGEAEILTGWRDLSGTLQARPAKPNEGNARTDTVDGRAVLALRDGVNCGFVLEDLTLDAPRISMAVAFAVPEGQGEKGAGTLLTLNPRDGRDYLFLTQGAGAAEIKFRDGVAGLSLACSEPGFSLLCVSVDGAKLKLSVDGGAPGGLDVASGLEAGFHDLFIGCRSDRAGILKTLGAAQIARVWVWPGEDVFADDTYCKLVDWWQRETQHGV